MVPETAVIRLRAGGTLCDIPAVSCPFHPGFGVAAATAVAVSDRQNSHHNTASALHAAR